MEKLRNKIVLIIDDEDRNAFALRSYLETLDMEIAVAKNGEDAISVLRQDTQPDIILLDMMMPVMDGYETLAILNGDDLLKRIPVIAVTARAMKGDREKCIEAGASDYITKPVDTEQLLSMLRVWLYK